jgi:hypothetical protein
MEKELTPEDKSEQELADKINGLLKEKFGMDLNRGCGVTLEKSHYIGDRTREIDEELKQLKTPKQ